MVRKHVGNTGWIISSLPALGFEQFVDSLVSWNVEGVEAPRRSAYNSITNESVI